ncbi:MAG: hypothetical protein ABI628_06710 [Chloroflexota bacterium]
MNDEKDPTAPIWTEAVSTPPIEQTPTVPVKGPSQRRTAAVAIVGSLIVGGAAGAAFFGPLTTAAVSPSASPTQSSTTGTQDHESQENHGGFGARHEAVSDLSVVAKAIGISQSDLTTALQGGQTIAQVATAHNVDVQKVIDALVADGMDELAAAVKAGTITQAQADARKAEVAQHATDQVNGTWRGGHSGRDGGFGARHEAVSDLSVVAKAIGISQSDLTTALQGGQTIAQVATAHNVDVQKVIDALVADGMDELAAAVKAGTITQAQADARKAEVAQHATDQVNGTWRGGHSDHGPDDPNDSDATPSPTP